MSDDDREILAWPRKSNWVRVVCVMPAEAFQVFDEARDKVARQYGINHPVEQVNNGLCLEVIAAEYLAS